MERTTLLANLQEIVRNVVIDDDLVITETTSAEDVEDWDSINHVEIISMVEEKFDIEFTTMEIENFKSVSDIMDAVQEKTK